MSTGGALISDISSTSNKVITVFFGSKSHVVAAEMSPNIRHKTKKINRLKSILQIFFMGRIYIFFGRDIAYQGKKRDCLKKQIDRTLITQISHDLPDNILKIRI
jgi:hypothetical protein